MNSLQEIKINFGSVEHFNNTLSYVKILNLINIF